MLATEPHGKPVPKSNLDVRPTYVGWNPLSFHAGACWRNLVVKQLSCESERSFKLNI